MPGGYPRRREDNVWRDIGGEVVILNEDGTYACLLNDTAAMIWTLSDGTKTMEEIAESICERFEVSLQEAVGDVQEFSAQLLEADLVEIRHQSIEATGE